MVDIYHYESALAALAIGPTHSYVQLRDRYRALARESQPTVHSRDTVAYTEAMCRLLHLTEAYQTLVDAKLLEDLPPEERQLCAALLQSPPVLPLPSVLGAYTLPLAVFGGGVSPWVRELTECFAAEIRVHSSHILAVAYHRDRDALRIRFKKGGVYLYSHVSPEVHRAFMLAASHGCYGNKHIYHSYNFQRVIPSYIHRTLAGSTDLTLAHLS